MEENSPVISVQRTEDTWGWTISSEDVLRHEMRVMQTSKRSFPTYEAAIADAESALESSTTP